MKNVLGLFKTDRLFGYIKYFTEYILEIPNLDISILINLLYEATVVHEIFPLHYFLYSLTPSELPGSYQSCEMVCGLLSLLFSEKEKNSKQAEITRLLPFLSCNFIDTKNPDLSMKGTMKNSDPLVMVKICKLKLQAVTVNSENMSYTIVNDMYKLLKEIDRNNPNWESQVNVLAVKILSTCNPASFFKEILSKKFDKNLMFSFILVLNCLPKLWVDVFLDLLVDCCDRIPDLKTVI